MCKIAFYHMVDYDSSLKWTRKGRHSCRDAPFLRKNIQCLKSYFGEKRHLEFIKSLRRLSTRGVYSILRPSSGLPDRVLSVVGMIELLLLAMETFYLFVWQLNDAKITLEMLTSARGDILSVMAFAEHPLWPAPHYMLNHFFEDLQFMTPIPPR